MNQDINLFTLFLNASINIPVRNPCHSSVWTRFYWAAVFCSATIFSLADAYDLFVHMLLYIIWRQTSGEPWLRTTDAFMNPDNPLKHQIFIRSQYPGVPLQVAVVMKGQIFIKAHLLNTAVWSGQNVRSCLCSALSRAPYPSEEKTWEVQGISGNPTVFSSLMEVHLFNSLPLVLTAEHVWKNGS